MEEEQHVCLPAGFNLKHMYWLPFVVPAQIRDHNSPVSVPLDLGQTLAQRGDLDPFPCPPPPVAQESGLDTALWTESLSWCPWLANSCLPSPVMAPRALHVSYGATAAVPHFLPLLPLP